MTRRIINNDQTDRRPKVKVCVHETCCMRGSEKIFQVLHEELSQEADVSKTQECFRFCKSGPNVAVNGNVLKAVHVSDAVSLVRREIRQPSRKLDGVGMRSINDLDDLIDSISL